MKRFLIALILLTLTLSLASCGSGVQSERDRLLALSDDELYERIYFHNLIGMDGPEDSDASEEQRLVYVLMEFESEVANGGLCQFFVNSSSECAPYVSDALEKVGAVNIQKRYDDFLAENGIDVNDLSSFKTDVLFIEQAERYDFDSFDDRFYSDDDIQGLIVSYIREHIDAFVK